MFAWLGTIAANVGSAVLGKKLLGGDDGDAEYSSDVKNEINRITGIANTFISQVPADAPERNQIIQLFNNTINKVAPRNVRHDTALATAQTQSSVIVQSYKSRATNTVQKALDNVMEAGKGTQDNINYGLDALKSFFNNSPKEVVFEQPFRPDTVSSQSGFNTSLLVPIGIVGIIIFFITKKR